MKNNKGFTLIEVMVALVIIALIIFAFTPLTVFSFKQIYDSGIGQKNLYLQKSNIEEKLSTRSTNTGLPSVMINTIFKETTHAGENISEVGPIPVTGAFVTDSGDMTDFELATVYTAIGAGDSKAIIRLAPNSVSENDDLSGKIIYVYPEFMIFTADNANDFKLYNNKGIQISGITFTYHASSGVVLMELNNSVTAADAPYTVQLGDTGALSAKLFVEPPNIIVASDNGIYFTSKGLEADSSSQNAIFNKSNITIAGNVNDLAWDPNCMEYIAVGNGGIYRTLAGGNTWANHDIIGDGSMIYSGSILGAYRNRTPDIKAAGMDYNGIPSIGGNYMYQERFLGWYNVGTHGFVSTRNVDCGNLASEFPNHRHSSNYLTINDIHTTSYGNTLFTLAAGKYYGNYAHVMARSASLAGGAWFDSFNYTDIMHPEVTGITSGLTVIGGSEQPAYVFCTANGKIYSANQITANSTTWAEETIGSGGPGVYAAIAYGGNKFVAVGNSGKALVGTPGDTGGMIWRYHTIVSGSTFNDIAYINDRFYVVGSRSDRGIIYTTTDGETWVEAQLNGGSPPARFISIAGRN